MLPMRRPVSFSHLKIPILVINKTLYTPLAMTRFWRFPGQNLYLRSKITHFTIPSRGPNFSFSRLKIHLFGRKKDTLCSTHADPILAFHVLKCVFMVKI